MTPEQEREKRAEQKQRPSRAVIIPLSQNGVLILSCTAEYADEMEARLANAGDEKLVTDGEGADDA